MIVLSDRSGPVPELDFEIERLRKLLDDLRQIRRGQHPDEKALVAAPRIEDWNLARRAVLCLTGKVFGHPIIGEGKPGVTTDLWVIAPSLGYARTLSRFYVLGPPEGFADRRPQ